MRRSPILTLACAMLAALAIMTSTAAAQTATGQITGTVRDATGAVMSGVKVVVTNQQTGLNRETKTGSNGDYVVPLLPAGVYLVTAEQTGFKTAILSDVALMVEQIQRLDFTLAPGAVSETVEVQASTLALDTSVGTPAAVLSVDAIQEFKEQTTTYSAEYGFSSNQINLVSRTGTNSFHRFRVLQKRGVGREELLRRQDLPGAAAGSEAVRVRRGRAGDARPDVLPRQLRGDSDRSWRDELLHGADGRAVVWTLQHADHRSGNGCTFPEQYDPAVAILAARAGPSPETPTCSSGPLAFSVNPCHGRPWSSTTLERTGPTC